MFTALFSQIRFNLSVKNESKKTVKGIMVAVVQNVEITLLNGHFNKRVATLETREGCPITPGSSMTKTFALTPTLNGLNKDMRGLALDGYLKVFFYLFSLAKKNKPSYNGIQFWYRTRKSTWLLPPSLQRGMTPPVLSFPMSPALN